VRIGRYELGALAVGAWKPLAPGECRRVLG
jgi:hypothetical protein